MEVFKLLSGEERDGEILAHEVGLVSKTVKFEFTRNTVESLRNEQPCGTSGGEKVTSVYERGIPLRPGDIQQMILAENGWLNDEMINRAMDFLNKKHPLQRQHEHGKTIRWDSWRAEALHAFWSTKIQRGEVSVGYISNWMNDRGMTNGKQPQLDCVILPSYHNRHWILTVVFPLRHKIAILDSLVGFLPAGRAATVYEHICEWLHAHMKDDFDEQKWTLVQLPCPQQQNSHDCGIHVVLNAWFISKGIWPMAHKDVTPGDRRLFAAYMVSKGTKDCPIVIR